MVTGRCSNQQISIEHHRELIRVKDSAFGYELHGFSSTFWSAPSISESELQATEKTVWCAAYLPTTTEKKPPKMTQNVFLAIGGLHGDKLFDTITSKKDFRNYTASLHYIRLFPVSRFLLSVLQTIVGDIK